MIKKSIKPLKPSLRESNRYVAFEVMSRQEIKDFDHVKDAIKTELRYLIGDLGLAKANMQVVKNVWDPSSQRGIIKVERKYQDHIKAALTLVKSIDGKQTTLRSLHSSGMINRIKKLLLGG
jgi:RNase P/RNase MRP subunit POP5